MPYLARRDTLPELGLTGGIDDPRARSQPSFSSRMSCRDLVEFISSTSKPSPLESARIKTNGATNGTSHKSENLHATAELEKLLPRPKKNGEEHSSSSSSYSDQQQPLSDLVPGLITSGGLSRSPAFDCLPVVSHWSDRTNESSSEDPTAAVRLTSTWNTVHVASQGTTNQSPLGAPAWSLKTHGIGPIQTKSPKFTQQYDTQTDTLTTSVNLPHRQDTPGRTGGVLAAATNISWMRNTRVADAVDCAVGLLDNASALLLARDKILSTPNKLSERTPFAQVRRLEKMPTWCTTTTRKPLPPKLSGVALSNDTATLNVLTSEGVQGGLVNASIFSMAVGYNRGVYGGSISGLWAVMDSAFVVDYTVGTKDAALSESLASSFADVADIAQLPSPVCSAGEHITDIRVVKGCNYACLRQKTLIEDSSATNSSSSSAPIIVIWDDLAQLARYKLADAVFCHVYYDSGGGEQMAAVAGLGCVVHDWLDLGADISCGEVSNIIPTLTGGSLDEDSLAEVYARLTGVMIWYRDNDPFNPAALALLFTHWWQLANCRHRPVALLGRTDISVQNAPIAGVIFDERPGLEDFRAQGGILVERGEVALRKAEDRLRNVIGGNPLRETREVIELLVKPVLAYVKGENDSLPAENEYLGAVLAAEIAYPHDKKILELWDLAIVMWECGALWCAGVAALCYTHTGRTNCDRARDDLSYETWA